MKKAYIALCALFIALVSCQSKEEICQNSIFFTKKEELNFKILEKKLSGRISDVKIQDIDDENNLQYKKSFYSFFYVRLFNIADIGDTILKRKSGLIYYIKKKDINLIVVYSCKNDMSQGYFEYKAVDK